MMALDKRMRVLALAAVTLTLSVLLQAAPASAVFIDFETYPGGAATTAFDSVNTQYSAWGVGLIESEDNNLSPADPVIAKYADYPVAYSFPSGVTALAPFPNTTAPPPAGYTGTYGAAQAPIRVYFTTPLSYFSIYALDVGFNGFEATAYAADLSVLSTVTIDGTGRTHNGTNVTGNGLDFIEFTTPGISYVSFAQILDADWDRANNKGLEGYLLDDMTFLMVPEPASVLLLASGFLGLWGFRRQH